MKYIAIIFFLIITSGCAKQVRNALPEEHVEIAQVVGFEQVRDWGDEFSSYFQKDVVASHNQFRDFYPEIFNNKNHTIDILTISGGGAYGAYGIGLLDGWSDKGDYPVFRLVTGISTGALIAPFAFLGGKYLDVVADFYLAATNEGVFERKSIRNIIFSDSVASSEPLHLKIESAIDDEMLEKIAIEHKKGRRLFVGTTNLDARRLVIWNMGHIASIGGPKARELFHKIILASASIPVALNPVYIPVKANGAEYDEMHVDGGVNVEVFFYGNIIDVKAGREEVVESFPEKVRIFIIRNSQIENRYKPVDPRIVSIAKAAISNLIGSQGVGDLYRIYAVSERDEIDYNLASIPADFKFKESVGFDPEEMKRLYDVGYEEAINGYSWEKTPPGFKE